MRKDGLNLSRHPEGGWFRETYRASETIPADALPARFERSRSFSTAIQRAETMESSCQ